MKKLVKNADKKELITAISMIDGINNIKGTKTVNQGKNCLTDEEIAIFVDGIKDSPEYSRLVKHLSECGECLQRAIDVKKFLNIKVSSTPDNLKIKPLGSNIRKKQTQRGKNNFKFIKIILPIAAAAVFVVAVATYFLVIKENFIFKSDFQYNISLNTKNVEVMMESHAGFINKLAGGAGYKSSGEKLTSEKISYDEKRRSLLHAGFIYFLLKNSSHGNELLLKRLSDELNLAGLDSIEAVVRIEQGKHADFESWIKSTPHNERNLFKAGFLLGMTVYADENNLLTDKNIISVLENGELKNVINLREYISSLKSMDMTERKKQREKVIRIITLRR